MFSNITSRKRKSRVIRRYENLPYTVVSNCTATCCPETCVPSTFYPSIHQICTYFLKRLAQFIACNNDGCVLLKKPDIKKKIPRILVSPSVLHCLDKEHWTGTRQGNRNLSNSLGTDPGSSPLKFASESGRNYILHSLLCVPIFKWYIIHDTWITNRSWPMLALWLSQRVCQFFPHWGRHAWLITGLNY